MPLTIAWDIDGVVSPIVDAQPTTGSPGRLAPDREPAWPVDQYLHLSPMHGMLVAAPVQALMQELDRRPGVTNTWNTSWKHEANEVLAPELGVGADWPHLSESALGPSAAGWWKQAAVENWLTNHAEHPGAHLIWIDDHIDRLLDDTDFGDLVTHPQLTMICPAKHIGLTPVQLDAIRALAAVHAGAAHHLE